MSTTSRHIPHRDEAASDLARRPGAVSRRSIERVGLSDGNVTRRRARDVLSVEEPLEIVVAGTSGSEPISVTMRTPGADFDLVAGFLFAEGIIDEPADLGTMRYCPGRPVAASADAQRGNRRQLYNRVEVRLERGVALASARARQTYTTSSCGVCGMASIEAVMALACPLVGDGPCVSPEMLLSLPPRLRAAQAMFERTGGLHAAALFAPDGTLLCIREDVGRHNAMDKLVGAAFLKGELPLRDRVLLLSGRTSFELVQKAARAGIAVVAGVSAPSALAVELAERTGITLVGFLRESGFNVYAGGDRIGGPASRPPRAQQG